MSMSESGRVLSRSAAAVQVRKPCPRASEHGNRLCHHRRCPGLVHTSSLSDHRNAAEGVHPV